MQNPIGHLSKKNIFILIGALFLLSACMPKIRHGTDATTSTTSDGSIAALQGVWKSECMPVGGTANVQIILSIDGTHLIMSRGIYALPDFNCAGTAFGFEIKTMYVTASDDIGNTPSGKIAITREVVSNYLVSQFDVLRTEFELSNKHCNGNGMKFPLGNIVDVTGQCDTDAAGTKFYDWFKIAKNVDGDHVVTFSDPDFDPDLTGTTPNNRAQVGISYEIVKDTFSNFVENGIYEMPCMVIGANGSINYSFFIIGDKRNLVLRLFEDETCENLAGFHATYTSNLYLSSLGNIPKDGMGLDLYLHATWFYAGTQEMKDDYENNQCSGDFLSFTLGASLNVSGDCGQRMSGAYYESVWHLKNKDHDFVNFSKFLAGDPTNDASSEDHRYQEQFDLGAPKVF